MSELSTRLHLRRKELGLSQEELAQRMGYRSKSSITKLEKGINDLPQSKVEELAAACRLRPHGERAEPRPRYEGARRVPAPRIPEPCGRGHLLQPP